MPEKSSLISHRRSRQLEAALDSIRDAIPCEYAQWVVESPATWDYVVVGARFPPGGECYEICHRPGVIGQVFRRKRAIFIPNVEGHPLYDLYDPAITWEMALPLFSREGLAAVLNLEGQGDQPLDEAIWKNLQDLLASETGWRTEGEAPLPGEAWMTKTATVPVPMGAVLALGRAAAAGGAFILIAGPLDLEPSTVYPTLEEALERGEPLGACVGGGGPGLDYLKTDSPAMSNGEHPPWWSFIDGRYDFVLLATPKGTSRQLAADTSAEKKGREEGAREEGAEKKVPGPW
jgi:hypothetical protein